ncbi:Ubiquitin-conjugating enzyme E2 1 [Fusarium oxysporum]|nr:Ubiquitin-conjugating enzyme E2 1 [Fusarium oxysporum]KAJ4100581.1 Ubiquitin-conjugating enzyme E2 1 [Fusarium oxysporum]
MAMSSRLRRVAKELQDFQDASYNLHAYNEADLTHLNASLPIPPGTPYSGGTYTINGEIAPGALGSWEPTNTIKSALDTIVRLLQQPDSNFPVNEEANTLFLRINSVFKERAQEWAVKYAGAPATETDSASYGGYNRNLIEPFIDMGYDKESVVKAFEYVGIDRNNGQDYALEEAYQGDILARLSDA